MNGSTKRMNQTAGANSTCEPGSQSIGPHPISPLCRTRPMISSSSKEQGSRLEDSMAENPAKKRQRTDFAEHSHFAPDPPPSLGTSSTSFKSEKTLEQSRSIVSSKCPPYFQTASDQNAAYRITYLNQGSAPLPEGKPLPMHPILPYVVVPRHQQTSTINHYESSEMLFLP